VSLSPPRLLLGLALAALVGYLGYRRGALTPGGVLGAILVGGAAVGLGGWAWGALVVLFFLASSALSRYKEAQKERLAEKFSKGARRDLAQALANGGVAALLAAAHAFAPHPALWAAFAGALAAVNADTWATELGVLSRAQPRLITTGRPVETGTSGGITWRGTGAALAGAGLIGLAAGLFGLAEGGGLARLAAVAAAATVGGLAGSLADSLLGATVQAIYFCPRCGKETERHPAHTCGEATRQVRGWRWLDNDWVNFFCSVVGALAAAGVWWVMR
jgi:uncharacterized protein (TIGR00297 family)